jgi:hypothetical protein
VQCNVTLFFTARQNKLGLQKAAEEKLGARNRTRVKSYNESGGNSQSQKSAEVDSGDDYSLDDDDDDVDEMDEMADTAFTDWSRSHRWVQSCFFASVKHHVPLP